MQLLSERWHKTVRHPSTVLYRYLSMIGHTTEYFRYSMGLNFGFDTAMSIDHQTYLLYEDHLRLKQYLQESVENNLDFFLDHVNLCSRFLEQLLAVAKEIASEADWTSKSRRDIAAVYQRYMLAYLRAIPFRLSIGTLDRDVLRNKLVQALSADLWGTGVDIDTLLGGLVIQRKENYFAAELRNLTRLAAEVQATAELGAIFSSYNPDTILTKLQNRFPDFYRRLEEHRKEYAWFGMVRNDGDPWSVRDLILRLQERLQNDAHSLLDRARGQKRGAEERHRSLLEKYQFGDETLQLLNIASEYAYFRTQRADVFHVADYWTRPFMEEMASRCKLLYGQLVFLSPPEFVKLLVEEAEPPFSIIRVRQQGFAVLLENTDLEIVTGEAAENLLKQMSVETHSELKGMVANPGQVQGLVKILKRKEDIDKIERGHIVVSAATTPELALALSKAAAIITDEGGMLSHAAIISRELGIPCIVGTEQATQQLKDGDLIEVNATGSEGKVRILSRAN